MKRRRMQAKSTPRGASRTARAVAAHVAATVAAAPPQTIALYYLYAEGCPACTIAKSAVQALQSERRATLPVLHCNLDRKDWKPGGYYAKATPAYVLMGDGVLMRAHEGALNATELKRFVDGPWRVRGVGGAKSVASR